MIIKYNIITFNYLEKKFNKILKGEIAMIVKDDDVIKNVLEYVKDERYCQAVLIDGKWGAGKTFFVKEKLLTKMKEELPEKRIYYISLYGVSSSEQIVWSYVKI